MKTNKTKMPLAVACEPSAEDRARWVTEALAKTNQVLDLLTDLHQTHPDLHMRTAAWQARYELLRPGRTM